MPNQWKLDELNFADLKSAVYTLQDNISDLHAAWAERSDDWQSSEDGQVVIQWINGLEDLYDNIETAFSDLEENKELEL